MPDTSKPSPTPHHAATTEVDGSPSPVGAMRVDHQDAPLTASLRPTFSWRATPADQLRLWHDDDPTRLVWQTGVDDASDPVTGIAYGGPDLLPAHPYTWEVARPGATHSARFWTAPSRFPTAGRWIGAGAGSTIEEPVLRRRITVTSPLRAALLHVCGLGAHRASLDGVPVDDARLTPPYSAYDRSHYYVSTDVTHLLRTGEHELSISLGRGFYALPTPNVWGWHTAPWVGPLQVAADLLLVDTDGHRSWIGTDTDWEIVTGGTTSNCLYAGESFDATIAPGTPHAPVVTAGPGGRARPQQHPPVRVTWSGPLRWEQVGDSWVGDAGRTIAGWVQLRTSQAAQETVHITYAETLDTDRRCRPTNEHVEGERFQVDTYTGDGRPRQDWEPRYTYKGFRYVQLDGLSHQPDAETVLARHAHNDVARTGRFDSDEPLFATYTEAMARTLTNNLHHLPTDTPVYEKNGWTGDAQLATPTMLHLFDMRQLLAKWLTDLSDSMTADGAIPVIVPSPGWGYTNLAPSPEWTTVYPHLLRQTFRHHGDRALLQQHWTTLQRYLQWELSKLVDGLATSALGDYLPPGFPALGPDDPVLTATAFLHRALLESSEIAAQLGEHVLAALWRSHAAQLRQRLNTRHLDEDDHYRVRDVGYSQTANATALVLGLVPPRRVPGVAARLATEVATNGYRLDVGCIGASTLLKALTTTGHGDVALAVARQRTYPSWGHWFELGADTMWEMWQEDSRSRNHYFHGTVVQWLFEDVAGLRCGDDGWRTFQVRPALTELMQHASHRVETVRGTAAVSWHRAGDQLSVEVTVPEGATARASVPGTPLSLEGSAAAAVPVHLLRGGHWRLTGQAQAPARTRTH